MAYQVIFEKTAGNLQGSLPTVIQGSTLETITVLALYRDGSNVNLTGKTISGTATDNDGNTYTLSGTFVGANGSFTWELSAGDVGTANTYAVVITYTDGVDEWSSDPVRFIVRPNPSANAVQNPALVDATAWLIAAGLAVPNGADVVDTNDLGTAAFTPATDYEPALGNPLVSGYALVSTDAGVRSWSEMTGGGAALYSIVVDAGGDGDYTTIAAALASASAGDAIFIRNGTYAGGFTISLSNITLIGESRDGVIIQSPSNSVTPAISVSGAGVTLRDLKVDGRRDLQTGAGTGDVGNINYSGIYVTGTDFLAQNIWLFETRGMGIVGATGSHRGRLLSSRIENRATNGSVAVAGAYSYGVLVTGAVARWQIINNTITGWSQGVGLWWGVSECQIVFNFIIDNYGYLEEAHTSTRSAVEDYGANNPGHGNNIWAYNTIDGSTSNCIECAQGVVGSQFIGNTLRNYNKFGDNTGVPFGITDGGAGQRTYDIIFKDNSVYGHDVQGSCYAIGANITIENNYFYDFTNSTIGLGTLWGDLAITTGLKLTNNSFNNCRGGPAIGATCGNGATISGNRINASLAASTLPKINITGGSYHVISENYLNGTGAGGQGIYVDTTAGDGHRITNNTCIGQTSYAIDVRRGYCQVTHNHCVTSNVMGAIHLSGATAKFNNVRWNYCDAANNWRTIFLESSTSKNVVQENLLIGDGAYVVGAAATDVWSPNINGSKLLPMTGVNLGSKTVGATQATIAHGQLEAPKEIRICMTSAGNIWKSAASDATNIYLTADSAGRTADVFVS